MLLINLLLFCASALAVSRSPTPLYSEDQYDLEQHFEEFIATYGKQYANEEEKQARFEIFKKTVAEINKKNSDPSETATFEINKFADLTYEEFKQIYTGLIVSSKIPDIGYEKVPRSTDLPDELDWRKKKAVTRVKDQGLCGSCWAFSATGALEGAYAIKHKELIELSEQQIVDCDHLGQDSGCGGGFMNTAIEYVLNAGGIEGESDYKYIADTGKCAFDASKVKAKVSKLLSYNLTNEEDTKQFLVKNGPIAIGVDASSLLSYSSGILQICINEQLNHGVLLVGYGKDGNTNYWIVKNSWGLEFGEKGYFRVAFRKGVNPCGMYNSDAAGAEMA